MNNSNQTNLGVADTLTPKLKKSTISARDSNSSISSHQNLDAEKPDDCNEASDTEVDSNTRGDLTSVPSNSNDETATAQPTTDQQNLDAATPSQTTNAANSSKPSVDDDWQNACEWGRNKPKRPSDRRARAWCFTSYKLELYDQYSVRGNELLTAAIPISYLVMQYEQGMSRKKSHLQGYVEFVNAVRMSSVKLALGDNAMHLEIRRGTQQQARDYCMKPRTRVKPPIEIGKFVGRGKRSDIDQLLDDVRKGDDDELLWQKHGKSMIKYERAIHSLRMVCERDVVGSYEPIKIVVIWGDAGLGKTSLVYERERRCNVYPMPDQNPNGVPFFERYHGEPALLIEDFEGETDLRLRTFLHLTDGRHWIVNVKGGSATSRWTRIYITSNIPPTDWYPHATLYQQHALARRLNCNGRGEMLQYIDATPNSKQPSVADLQRASKRTFVDRNRLAVDDVNKYKASDAIVQDPKSEEAPTDLTTANEQKNSEQRA